MTPVVYVAVALTMTDLVLTAWALSMGMREVIWGFFGQDNALVTAIAGNLALLVVVGLIFDTAYWQPWAWFCGGRALVVAVNVLRLRKQARINRERYGR